MREKTLGFVCCLAAALLCCGGSVPARAGGGAAGLGSWKSASKALRLRLSVIKRFRRAAKTARFIERELHATGRTFLRLEGTKGPRMVSPKVLGRLARRIEGHEAKIRKLVARLPRSGSLYGGTTPDDVIEALRDIDRPGPRGVMGRLYLVFREKVIECRSDKEAFLELDVSPGIEPVPGSGKPSPR